MPRLQQMRRIPSLRARLVLLCVALVAASIATTAAIVSVSTSASIQEQYTQDISAASAAYNNLLGYAATHRSWSGLTSTQLHRVAANAGRVVLTDTDRHVLASSDGNQVAPAPSALPAARVNPLLPDSSLSTSPAPGGIDQRAVGPFALPSAVAAKLNAIASREAACLTKIGLPGVQVAHYPNGRPYIVENGRAGVIGPCVDATIAPPSTLSTASPATEGVDKLPFVSSSTYDALSTPTSSETAAATQLQRLFAQCLKRAAEPQPADLPDPAQVDYLPALLEVHLDAVADSCLSSARRTQLAGYLAPPALLFISGNVATQRQPGISSTGLRRIVIAALLILLIALILVLLAAGSITRPLRSLTAAVDRLRSGERSVQIPARGSREVAVLAGAFNQMSAELVAAEDRRRQLIADVAHELRTPLGTIRGWLEAVQDGLAVADRELVSSLLDESVLLQSIIDDLQVLALADAGRLVVHPELVDLAELVAQVVTAQQPAAAGKDVALTSRSVGDLECEVDPVRVRQALGNLVGNAIRYTDAGSVEVLADGSGADIVLTVTDTGHGIAATDLPHVFDRFWRAERSRARRSGGSGLGLAITKHLVEAHGGTIQIDSAVGVGTVVTLRLPRQG